MADQTKILHVKKDWHDVMECPVCHEYLSAPILLCIKGHSICEDCKEKTEKCPLCEEQFSSGRNYTLEKIIERSSFPCMNSDYGCKVHVFLNEECEHNKTCVFREYECLVEKSIGCKWKGRRTDILGHVEKEHKARAWMKDKKLNILFKHFDISTDYEDNHIISVFGELFCFESFVCKLEKSFYISVHYIGASENCKKYFYKVHCKSFTNSSHEMLFCSETHSDTVKIRDLIKDKVGCFHLKHDTSKHFLKDGALELSLEIIHVP